MIFPNEKIAAMTTPELESLDRFFRRHPGGSGDAVTAELARRALLPPEAPAPKPAAAHIGCQACGSRVPCTRTPLGWMCDDCCRDH